MGRIDNRPELITSEPWMAMVFQLERNGALFGVHGVVRPKSAWHRRHCQRRLVTSVGSAWIQLWLHSLRPNPLNLITTVIAQIRHDIV